MCRTKGGVSNAGDALPCISSQVGYVVRTVKSNFLSLIKTRYYFGQPIVLQFGFANACYFHKMLKQAASNLRFYGWVEKYGQDFQTAYKRGDCH